MSNNLKITIDTKKLEKDLNKIISQKNRDIAIKNAVESRGGNMMILKETEKELLKLLMNKANGFNCNIVYGDYPKYISSQLKDLLSVLKYAGYLARFDLWIGGGQVVLTPEGLSYFEREKEYMKESNAPSINIEKIISNGGNLILGNVYDSTFNIDNSYNEIEKYIEKQGGEDTEDLKSILLEVRDYIENITETKVITKNNSLFKKIGNHFQKHQWFYQMMINMIGTAVLSKMSGQ